MVRAVGGRGRRNVRVSRPSAQETINSLGRSIFGDDFSGVQVAATRAEYKAMDEAWYDNTQSMEFYDPTEYENLAGTPYSMDTNFSRPFYEVVGLTGDLRVPGMKGPQTRGAEDTSPADLTLIPTSSSNPKRPRTVAAGYDPDEEKLTVMFRDGILYNYYEVDEKEWETFKANRSKGAVIYRMLDFKPRGYASTSQMSEQARQAFYRFSRGIQLGKGDAKIEGQSGTKYKPYTKPKKQKRKT